MTARASLRPLLALLPVVGCGPVVSDAVSDSSGESSETSWVDPSSADDSPQPSTSPQPSDDSVDPDPSITDSDPDTGWETTGEPPIPTTPIGGGTGFIDAFFTNDGLIVVHENGVEVVSRSGEVLASYASPRTVTAAGFDGSLLVVADLAIFTTLDTTLAALASATLTESCSGVVMISDSRFVCGPNSDIDRVHYTYDALSAELLATSDPYIYAGVPMRGVPGFDDYVTVTHDLSPSDFHLFRVDADSRAALVNESPYHGDFAATISYAFFGSPTTHLINQQGLLLKLHDDACAPGSPFDSGCFLKDGELGTLEERFKLYVDIREASATTVMALVSDMDFGFVTPPCIETACELQHIDVESRSVLATTTIATPMPVILLRPDPTTTATAIIAAQRAPFAFSLDEGSAYELLYVGL
jgi:hypothetical protein